MLLKNLLPVLMFLFIFSFKTQAAIFYAYNPIGSFSASENLSGGTRGYSYGKTSTLSYPEIGSFLNNSIVSYQGSRYKHAVDYHFLTKLNGKVNQWVRRDYYMSFKFSIGSSDYFLGLGHFNKEEYVPFGNSIPGYDPSDEYTVTTLFDASGGGDITYKFRLFDEYGVGPASQHIYKVSGALEHQFTSDNQTIFDIAQWIDNLRVNADLNIINNARKLLNGKNNNPKNKIINLKGPTAIGRRASVDLSGTNVHTSSPGWVTYELLLPSTDTFHLPFAFGDNKDEATLDIFLNDQLITTLLGVDYVEDELNTVALDISGLVDTTATIQFLLNTSGERADIFIPESINFSAVSTVSAVPEPSTYAMMILGLLGLMTYSRRQHS